MGLFTKSNKSPGWIAIGFQEDGICAVYVKRVLSAIPKVELALFYPINSASNAAHLEKIGKDLHAERYHCLTLMAASEYQLLSVDAPNVPPDELRTAIRWRLKDMLDFHIDDATIDVLDVPIDKNTPVRTRSMYAVAARNSLVEQRQALFSAAKIPLSVIDIPEMAQRNISALFEPEGRGLALLSFDAEGGLLTVTHNAELYLSRRIDVSLAQLSQADGDHRTACYDKITLELQRSLDHFDRQYHFIAIAKLMLSPLGEAATGLKEYLTANLYIPVEVLNLETVLDISNVPALKTADQQQHFFMTLGAALRHEEKVL